MPKVDGISLANKLKSNNKTKQIPIIISTAKDLTEEEKKSLNNIVEAIITKTNNQPFDVLKVVRDRIRMIESESTDLDVEVYDNSESEHIVDSQELSLEHSAEVLIVDDDPDTLFTLNEMVQATGCKTLLAKSGIECLRILEQTKPDLILLDIMMPEMDGFQTLKNIRNNTDLIDIPIYAVTAKAMVGDKEIILKHGFNDYIAKPVNSAIISGKISQLISRIKSN
jgi:CheY-like chemotaxis protein